MVARPAMPAPAGAAEVRPDVEADAHAGPSLPFPVRVIRSHRRVRTASARLLDGVLVVRLPAGMDADAEQRLVGELGRKVARQQLSATVDVDQRARMLARR